MRNSKNNFRCYIYENDDGAITLSNKWSYLTFPSFSDVRLYPKEDIDDPSSYLFRLGCFGAGVPTGSTDMMV